MILFETADRDETSLPLGEIPLSGEMGKAQKGCRSCKEKVSPQVTDEGLTFLFYQLYKGYGASGVDNICDRR